MSMPIRATDPRFQQHRDRLFGVAYRMTGSVVDAEDCVQESYLRWQRAPHDEVLNDEAFLVRIVTRLAIDRQRQTARRRETYTGPWLPEPLVADLTASSASSSVDPADEAELADSLSFAFLVLLDRLSPSERAAFILHDVFGVTFDEVATALERAPEACRQLASRARRKLRDGDESPATTRPAPPGTDAGNAMGELLGAMLSGDVNGCLAHLAPGVVLTSDAGPNRRAARRQVVGADRVARLLLNLSAREGARVTAIRPATVNGSLGLVIEHPDGPMVFTGGVDDDGRLARVWIQMNPEKLVGLVDGDPAGH